MLALLDDPSNLVELSEHSDWVVASSDEPSYSSSPSSVAIRCSCLLLETISINLDNNIDSPSWYSYCVSILDMVLWFSITVEQRQSLTIFSDFLNARTLGTNLS